MSRFRAWLAVAVLSAAYLLAIVDRGVLSLLIEPIERDLGVDDAQMGLLYGFAFVLLYAVAGVPAGWLADRWPRRRLAGLSIVAWSAATAVCGLAPGFWVLFAARVGVGVGEAGLSPAATSMIGDSFPARQTARPMAFYSLGGAAGPGVALLMGAGLLKAMDAAQAAGAPADWRAVFLALGVLGLVFSLALFLLKEPARSVGGAGTTPATGRSRAWLKAHGGFFAPHVLGVALAAAALVALTAWTPTRMGRDFGWSREHVGLALGSALLAAGPLGVTIAGALAGRLQAKGAARGHLDVALAAVIAGLPLAVLAPLAETPVLAVTLTALAVGCLSAPLALAPVPILMRAPSEIRGRLTGLYLLAVSLIGYGLGGWAPGQVTEALGGKARLGEATAFTVAVALAAAALLGLLARTAAGRTPTSEAHGPSLA